MFSEFIWPFLFWLYVAATLFQLLVWWAVFGKLRFPDFGFSQTGGSLPQLAHSPLPNPDPPVSIVICARNEAANLRRNLPAVLAQQYAGEWEIIVVDDASEDETAVVLRLFEDTCPRLRVVSVFEKKQVGKKHALSLGIEAAKHEHLLLTDADCVPASVYWLAHMATALCEKQETELVLGYGPVFRAPGFLNGWIRFETAHTAIQYFSLALAGMPYMGVGRNLAFRKRAYDRAGGFSAHLDLPSGDDDLLVNAVAARANTAICRHPGAFVYSEGKKTWRAWMRQKRRHLAAGPRYRLLHRVILTMISLSHSLHFFLLVVLLSAGFGMVSVLFLFLARSGSLLYLYGKILPQLCAFQLFSRIPIYDALLAAYYGAFVPISLFAPHGARSAWK